MKNLSNFLEMIAGAIGYCGKVKDLSRYGTQGENLGSRITDQFIPSSQSKSI